jgi:hypothetical protein
MLAEDEAELLQLQHDRLILNWRRLGEGAYPSYEALRARFSARWQEFLGAIADAGHVRPTIVEVTFVNTLPATAGWAALSEVIASAGVPDIRGECVLSGVPVCALTREPGPLRVSPPRSCTQPARDGNAKRS